MQAFSTTGKHQKHVQIGFCSLQCYRERCNCCSTFFEQSHPVFAAEHWQSGWKSGQLETGARWHGNQNLGATFGKPTSPSFLDFLSSLSDLPKNSLWSARVLPSVYIIWKLLILGKFLGCHLSPHLLSGSLLMQYLTCLCRTFLQGCFLMLTWHLVLKGTLQRNLSKEERVD